MTVISVGKVSVTRVEETYLPTYPAKQIFPEWSDEINALGVAPRQRRNMATKVDDC